MINTSRMLILRWCYWEISWLSDRRGPVCTRMWQICIKPVHFCWLTLFTAVKTVILPIPEQWPYSVSTFLPHNRCDQWPVVKVRREHRSATSNFSRAVLHHVYGCRGELHERGETSKGENMQQIMTKKRLWEMTVTHKRSSGHILKTDLWRLKKVATISAWKSRCHVWIELHHFWNPTLTTVCDSDPWRADCYIWYS